MNDNTRNEFKMLAMIGGRTWDEIRDAMGMDERTFADTAKRLITSGAVERTGRGKDAPHEDQHPVVESESERRAVSNRGNVYCNTCGRWTTEDEGHTTPPTEFVDTRARSEYEYEQSQMDPAKGGWKITCPTCWNARESRQDAAVALSGILGVNEPQEVAQRVLHTLVTFDPTTMTFTGGVSAQGNDNATGKAWGHVTVDMRERLNAAYGEIVATSLPQTCTLGACGMCGRSSQVGPWHEGPDSLRWPDGSPTPLCDICNVVWEMRGSPYDIEDVRKVGVEIASGIPVGLGLSVPADLRLFAESKAADKAGTDEPWTYSAAMTEYIEGRWTQQPHMAPEDRREDYRQRHAELVREREEKYRQAQQEKTLTAW